VWPRRITRTPHQRDRFSLDEHLPIEAIFRVAVNP
jgi:hypothetical protein